jgi:hypothetical protein
MDIFADVEVVLGLSLRNLRGYNIDVIDGRDLRITPLRWGQVP